jgi:hypothetical protein
MSVVFLIYNHQGTPATLTDLHGTPMWFNTFVVDDFGDELRLQDPERTANRKVRHFLGEAETQ